MVIFEDEPFNNHINEKVSESSPLIWFFIGVYLKIYALLLFYLHT